jgi:negative regulator of sigma E activity
MQMTNTNTNAKRIPRLYGPLAVAGVALAAVIAGCGTSYKSSSMSSATPAPAPAVHSSAAPQHAAQESGHKQTAAPQAPSPEQGASAASAQAAAIPQNNGGDQDADNNGGPSDGDGNV